MSKNIHPTHTLSSEELKERYIEIYPNIKRDIEFFIETYPQTSSPLFISGQIGSGKSTLLKSFLFDDQTIHYFDISDLFIQNPNDSMEVCLAILHKIIELIYPESDLSPIDYYIEKNKSNDMFDSFTSEEIIDTIQAYKKNNKTESKAIIVDGLDRLQELSDYNTIKDILFDYGYIWKSLEERLIFVTPLAFTQSNILLTDYNKVYESDSLSNTHITIPVPDPADCVFWKEFISIFSRDIPLALFTQREGKEMCVVHPLVDLESHPSADLVKIPF